MMSAHRPRDPADIDIGVEDSATEIRGEALTEPEVGSELPRVDAGRPAEATGLGPQGERGRSRSAFGGEPDREGGGASATRPPRRKTRPDRAGEVPAARRRWRSREHASREALQARTLAPRVSERSKSRGGCPARPFLLAADTSEKRGSGPTSTRVSTSNATTAAELARTIDGAPRQPPGHRTPAPAELESAAPGS